MAALWLSSVSSSSSHSCLFGYCLLSKPSQRSPPPNTTSTSYSTCITSWQELVGVLVFSAIPLTAVKAIANSSLGATLRKRLMETKASTVLNSSNFNASAHKAREYSFEILHACWAMLASLGAFVPELLDLSGVVHFIEPVWWRVGYAKLKASTS
ncbi:hypothetical protein IFM89_037303 [Coptis chinensis]|uniref:Chlorophyll a-b binding protein, chloroplastic n=1 Tax=Coptis chinensis TaxID=261450 RepID=A0A835I3M8_9MAGN|nr:hypothetical protein IFM89_037303 [Coptis chinensis]